MTNYYYSAANNIFVAQGSSLLVKGAFADAVPVDDSVFEEFFCGEKDGMRRVAADDGLPVWEVIPPPTAEELHDIAVQEAENRKALLLAEAAAITKEMQTDLLLGIISDEEKAQLIVWRTYIRKLGAVDTSGAPGTIWPEPPQI